MGEGNDEQMWVLDDEDLEKMIGDEGEESESEEEEKMKEDINYDDL